MVKDFTLCFEISPGTFYLMKHRLLLDVSCKIKSQHETKRKWYKKFLFSHCCKNILAMNRILRETFYQLCHIMFLFRLLNYAFKRQMIYSSEMHISNEKCNKLTLFIAIAFLKSDIEVWSGYIMNIIFRINVFLSYGFDYIIK